MLEVKIQSQKMNAKATNSSQGHWGGSAAFRIFFAKCFTRSAHDNVLTFDEE